MRYILDDLGYIETISFLHEIECNNKTCTEYTGSIPEGYSSLLEWSENAVIQAYKIVNGNLTYDANKQTELETEWARQQLPKESYISCIAKSGGVTTTTTTPGIDTWDVVPLVVECSLGSSFTLVDNQIVIGPGVNAVEVSAQAYYISNITDGDVIRIGVCLNNTGTAVRALLRAGGIYITYSTPPRIVPVKEGDVLDLRVSNGARTGMLVSSGVDTFITVRKVS